MKRIFYILFVFLLLLPCLSACRSDKYADSITVEDIASLALAAVGGNQSYNEADNGYLDDYFTLPDDVTESTIRLVKNGADSSSYCIDEIGVFHVKSGKAAELKALISSYLTKSYTDKQSFYDSYIPLETPKLRDAEVRVYGNYAVYAILDEAGRKSFFAAVENALKV